MSMTEFIYLHGLVLARKSTCVSKNDNHEAQHRICQRICLNGFVLPCLQPPLCRVFVAKGDIDLKHVRTDKQLADIFTKPLDEKVFCRLRGELNIIDASNLE